jgi:hypothetical protein
MLGTISWDFLSCTVRGRVSLALGSLHLSPMAQVRHSKLLYYIYPLPKSSQAVHIVRRLRRRACWKRANELYPSADQLMKSRSACSVMEKPGMERLLHFGRMWEGHDGREKSQASCTLYILLCSFDFGRTSLKLETCSKHYIWVMVQVKIGTVDCKPGVPASHSFKYIHIPASPDS